jgi:hypothetical protein
MNKPPDGYSCDVIGFNNVPSTASDKMPVPTNKASTPLADAVAQTSNTTRLPVPGPMKGA